MRNCIMTLILAACLVGGATAEPGPAWFYDKNITRAEDTDASTYQKKPDAKSEHSVFKAKSYEKAPAPRAKDRSAKNYESKAGQAKDQQPRSEKE